MTKHIFPFSLNHTKCNLNKQVKMNMTGPLLTEYVNLKLSLTD